MLALTIVSSGSWVTSWRQTIPLWSSAIWGGDRLRRIWRACFDFRWVSLADDMQTEYEKGASSLSSSVAVFSNLRGKLCYNFRWVPLPDDRETQYTHDAKSLCSSAFWHKTGYTEKLATTSGEYIYQSRDDRETQMTHCLCLVLYFDIQQATRESLLQLPVSVFTDDRETEYADDTVWCAKKCSQILSYPIASWQIYWWYQKLGVLYLHAFK